MFALKTTTGARSYHETLDDAVEHATKLFGDEIVVDYNGLDANDRALVWRNEGRVARRRRPQRGCGYSRLAPMRAMAAGLKRKKAPPPIARGDRRGRGGWGDGDDEQAGKPEARRRWLGSLGGPAIPRTRGARTCKRNFQVATCESSRDLQIARSADRQAGPTPTERARDRLPGCERCAIAGPHPNA